jgi:hypothetical protein
MLASGIIESFIQLKPHPTSVLNYGLLCCHQIKSASINQHDERNQFKGENKPIINDV